MSASVRTLFAASASFEAARHVDILPAGHRLRRLHGHGFLAQVRCALLPGWARFPGGEVDRLRGELASRTARLDHRLLNEEVQHPTDENLARWLQRQRSMHWPAPATTAPVAPRLERCSWRASRSMLCSAPLVPNYINLM